MKNGETKLNQLFAAARPGTTDTAAVQTLPAHIKVRVLAHWRSGAEEIAALWLSAFFGRALACAAIIMAASVTWAVATDEPDDEVAVANYELRADLFQ